MGHIGAVEPNQARWMISAPSVFPGVSACKDWGNLSLNVTALLVITGCNQQVVCWRCSPPANSLSWPQREPFSAPDEKLFCLVQLPLCYLSHYILISLLLHSDGPGSAVTVGDERRQRQLLLWFTQGLPSHHHHLFRTLTVHNQTSGHQHDRQRQASR